MCGDERVDAVESAETDERGRDHEDSAHRSEDPASTAEVLTKSASTLLDGGTAPGVEGDDDETKLSPASGATVRAQLKQSRRLVTDLTATGAALLAHRSVDAVPMTAREKLRLKDPISRLRALAGLSSNVSLNAVRTLASESDRNIANLIDLQVALGVAGLMAALLLGWALIAAARRQTAHFRSLVTSSTDLVLAFGSGGLRYVSESVTEMVDRPAGELLGTGLSIKMALVSILGGVGTLFGPVVGAVVLTVIEELTRVVFGGSGRGTDTIIYAALIVAIAVFYPNGLLGWWRERRRRGQAQRAALREEAAR